MTARVAYGALPGWGTTHGQLSDAPLYKKWSRGEPIMNQVNQADELAV